MSDRSPAQWDASNAIRLCDHDNEEYGAGCADEGDRGCAVCGQETAPHIYVPFPEVERLSRERDKARAALQRITDDVKWAASIVAENKRLAARVKELEETIRNG